ncbi:protein MIS12 homolog [Ipomoea triloba]|uniref:protein MIS12 homolog n=1 Tax=Ipomoea triloba TaxID=35885 RepID=UPI00125D419A|nr:protein MIS12 homolog [Ipomoea triloba]GMD37471.1 protein MIS12 homolog [Ipomoea batatas]
MEGSESEKIFDSFNLNPQLFINEVINSVDDLVDEAFDFFQQEAAVNLKTEGTDRSDDLKKVSMIQYFRYSAIKTSNSPFAQIKSSFYCRCVE